MSDSFSKPSLFGLSYICGKAFLLSIVNPSECWDLQLDNDASRGYIIVWKGLFFCVVSQYLFARCFSRIFGDDPWCSRSRCWLPLPRASRPTARGESIREDDSALHTHCTFQNFPWLALPLGRVAHLLGGKFRVKTSRARGGGCTPSTISGGSFRPLLVGLGKQSGTAVILLLCV